MNRYVYAASGKTGIVEAECRPSARMRAATLLQCKPSLVCVVLEKVYMNDPRVRRRYGPVEGLAKPAPQAPRRGPRARWTEFYARNGQADPRPD